MGNRRSLRSKDFRFAYRLLGNGWAEATVSQDGIKAWIPVSFISDALGDLTAAVVALLRGAEDVTVRWVGEPGEYRWYLAQAGGRVQVRITRLSGQDPGRAIPHEEEELFVASCTPMRLATQVRGALRQLLNEHGPDGYLALWKNHPFPLSDFERLTEATHR